MATYSIMGLMHAKDRGRNGFGHLLDDLGGVFRW
jgi:hypothetical protein